MAEKKIDPRLIEGLHFHHSEEREVEDGEEGVKTKRVAAKRPLTPGDVLDWKKNEDGTHSIVTACGKHWVRAEDAEKVTFTRAGVSPDFYAKDKDGKHLKNRPIVIPKDGKKGGGSDEKKTT